nr:uncharacterized protein LOC109029503 [Gorilla gorilla gorilla]
MDAHEIWYRDLDRGTSLGRSIPCPPALCSVRKIHLRSQVLRPTSPRNISPISNPRQRRHVLSVDPKLRPRSWTAKAAFPWCLIIAGTPLIIHPGFRGVRPRRDACLRHSALAASPTFLG